MKRINSTSLLFLFIPYTLQFECFRNEVNCYNGLIGCECFGSISVINASVIDNNDCGLDILSCSNCEIDVVEEAAFENQEMRALCLDHNHINEVIIKNMTNIIVISVTNNKLSILRNDSFRQVYQLERLFLMYNNITTIEQGAFEDCGSLKIFNISHNALTALRNGSFEKQRELLELDLSYNQLEELPKNIFTNNINMLRLYISNNKLTFLTNTHLFHMTKLKVLDLSYNKLQHLDNFIFFNLNNLEEIFLNNNNFFDLNLIPILDITPNLLRIAMENNAWSCNSLVQILEEITIRNIVLRELEYYNELKLSCDNNTDVSQNLINIPNVKDYIESEHQYQATILNELMNFMNYNNRNNETFLQEWKENFYFHIIFFQMTVIILLIIISISLYIHFTLKLYKMFKTKYVAYDLV